MESFEFKPCKKCGYTNHRKIRYGHFEGESDTFRITCPNCSYQTKEKPTLDEARDAWNSICNPYSKKVIEI